MRKSKSCKSGRSGAKITLTKKESETFEQFLQKHIKMLNHPYETECIKENGKIFCRGNFKITYLNLSCKFKIFY